LRFLYCFASWKTSQNVNILQYLHEVNSKFQNNHHYGCKAAEALGFVLSYITRWNNFPAVKINEAVGKRIWKASKIRYSFVFDTSQSYNLLWPREQTDSRFCQVIRAKQYPGPRGRFSWCFSWDKVTVKFVAHSDDILIYALQKWEQFSLVYILSLKKKGFRPVGLSLRPVGLCFRPQGLRFRPVGLRSSVFIFYTSYLGASLPCAKHHKRNRPFSHSVKLKRKFPRTSPVWTPRSN